MLPFGVLAAILLITCTPEKLAEKMKKRANRRKNTADVVEELCTSLDFVHAFEPWSKIKDEAYGYHQYRQCEHCGLGQRRKVRTQA